VGFVAHGDADEFVQIELVPLRWREFGLRSREDDTAPAIGGGLVVDAFKLDQPTVLERPTALDQAFALRGVSANLRDFLRAIRGCGCSRGCKNRTAGREDRVRLVGDRMDQEFALQPEGLANPADDREVYGQASETGTAALASFLASRAS
jgi:hypothetical protein